MRNNNIPTITTTATFSYRALVWVTPTQRKEMIGNVTVKRLDYEKVGFGTRTYAREAVRAMLAKKGNVTRVETKFVSNGGKVTPHLLTVEQTRRILADRKNIAVERKTNPVAPKAKVVKVVKAPKVASTNGNVYQIGKLNPVTVVSPIALSVTEARNLIGAHHRCIVTEGGDTTNARFFTKKGKEVTAEKYAEKYGDIPAPKAAKVEAVKVKKAKAYNSPEDVQAILAGLSRQALMDILTAELVKS